MRRRITAGIALTVMAWAAAGAPARAADSTAAPADTSLLPFRLVAIDTLMAPPENGVRPEPSGLAVDAFGRVFVADAGLHGLLRMDANGLVLGQAGTLGSGEGELRRPSSVALLGTLRVVVLDTENRRVVAYDLFDRLQGTLIEFGSLEEPPGRIDPISLASDRGGAVYVADRDRDRVVVFDFAGRFVRVLGGFGEAPGSFREPSGMAVNRLGELIVSERVGRRIQRLDAAGQPRGWWTLPAGGGGELAVATDDSLRVAVADEGRGTTWVFDPGGRLLAEARGLNRPRALAFAADGTLIIGERGNGRLRRFALASRAPDAGD